MKYEERYLSDLEEQEQEERIKQKERLEDLEKAIKTIKQLIFSVTDKEELIGEIKWIIADL